jgi:hypothetical protein
MWDWAAIIGGVVKFLNLFMAALSRSKAKQDGRNEQELDQRRKNDELEDILDRGVANTDRVPDDEIIRRG